MKGAKVGCKGHEGWLGRQASCSLRPVFVPCCYALHTLLFHLDLVKLSLDSYFHQCNEALIRA